jgi:thymidylate kinase
MNEGTTRASAKLATGSEPVAPSAGLVVVRRLLERLHAAGIVYCSWKSNEHLGPAVEGLTDLDVLVDRRQYLHLQGVLAETGLKRFAATALRGYPAVEDYLGFDPATGALSHLHLHYELTLGQPYLKGYRLPWEEQVLATRVFDTQHGMYVADPKMELVLLLVRGALKRRLRDVLKRRPSEGYRRELEWLIERVDADEACETARELLGADVEAPLRNLLAHPDAPEHQRRFAKAALPVLRRHRTYGPVSATVRALSREVQRIAGTLNRRALHRPVPFKRVSPRGGTVVAFLGSDGSGKSSLVKETVDWLQVKLDVVPIYFGSGDGPGSLLRLPLQLARRATDAMLGNATKAAGGGEPSRRARSVLRPVALVPWALSLSLEKRAKLRRMIEARNRGMIVICDRYAQAEFPGFNDGPLLHAFGSSRWRLCRALAAWEARPYAEARLIPPDLVIKLVVSADIALSRRPEMNIAEVRRRVDAVSRLTFPDRVRVAEVESDKALDQVVLATKRLAWEEL